MNDQQSNAHEFTVSEISQAVKRSIEDEFGHVRVRGEVGRLSRPGSGHLYFDLKDENAVMSAVAWKGVVGRWRFQPEQGLEVIVTGKLTTFPGQSKYQIIVENVEPAGAGALMALLEERRKKLAAEGLFDKELKKELPYLPKTIGVVTSPSGAVIRDILHRLDDRFPTHVIVWPVRVQGESSAAEVANAIRGFNALIADGPIARPDLLIVARGGGSVEDLWGFNEEEVVRAAAESDIPLISAVGHETDITLIDYVADRRAPTPTGAAEMAVPVRTELIAYVDTLGGRQRTATRRIASSLKDRLRAAAAGLPRAPELLSTARQRLDFASERLASGLHRAGQRKALLLANIAPRLSASLLRQRTSETRNKVNQLADRMPKALGNVATRAGLSLMPVTTRLKPAFNRYKEQKARELTSVTKLLDSLGHKSILKRGFALITDAKGNLVRSAGSVASGDALTLELADGKVSTIATDGPAKPAKPKSPKTNPDDNQSSLF